MHQNQGGRVFGRHLDNFAEKAFKDAKDRRNGLIDEIGGKENVINDAVLTKDGWFKIDCPQKVLQYQQEIYEFLHQREQESQGFQNNQRKINETMRNTTIRFVIKQAKLYNLKSETLFQTVDLIDQAIQYINPEVEKLELIAITCLFIASKYEEIYPPPLGVLIRGTELRVREVIEMEKEILYKLNFNVISDNTLIWLQLIGELLGCNKRYLELIKQRSMYLAELSLSNDRFLSIKKSTIALTIFLAVEIQFGYQKTQFQWDRLSQHSKPSKDSKPLKLFAYCLKK
ncbi:unnamed protein product [Paramecium primaurelia]|uniref:Cyclin-like domain-containing protein n=2 Tax=Paramecium TaxID=5884 RepID=A0A8S1UEQ3_9CILI|nr:unnamed protein product [Paramecium primaurelia]CAD8163358.1 unnamed protein product [Paramecium pentaurelia]